MSRASSQALTSDVCETIDIIRSIYAIDTVSADTETGLANGFAWLIYFNVVGLNSSRLRPRLRLRLETETETLKFESQDVARPRLKS